MNGERRRSPRMIYRAMKEADDGSPETGRSARTLGVRVEGRHADLPLDPQGFVEPNTGGMSVVPDDPLNLPKHRRPRSLGGEGRDPVFAIDVVILPNALSVRMDTSTHALVEPRIRCHYSKYEKALYSTRKAWRKAHE